MAFPSLPLSWSNCRTPTLSFIMSSIITWSVINNNMEGEVMLHWGNPSCGVGSIKIVHIHFGIFVPHVVIMKGWFIDMRIVKGWLISKYPSLEGPSLYISMHDVPTNCFQGAGGGFLVAHICVDVQNLFTLFISSGFDFTHSRVKINVMGIQIFNFLT